MELIEGGVMASIGIEWVNDYHKLSWNLINNDDNARGFLKTLDGVKQFDYGDDQAWDQDFEQSGVGSPAAGSDQSLVDDVDIAFFSGHGGPAGPIFGRRDRDDGVAAYTEMRLGDRNLEWIVFDGCNVLESPGAIRRWGRVFKGLHYILGFHTTCHDVKDRGEKFARRLNAGWTVREAWWKACAETEGSATWWAYLRAEQRGTNTRDDHWHGKGFVSAEPSNPTGFCYQKGYC